MRKATLLFVMILLLLPLVMTGCGVAKSEYEAVVADRDTAKAQVASLQAENDALQTERDTLQANKSDVASLVTALDKKLAAEAMLDGYLSDASKYVGGTMSMSDLQKSTAEFMADFGGTLDAVGDAELSQLWKDALLAATKNDQKGFNAKLAVLMDSLTGLINNDIATIVARLR
jgi:cell division protein FtsL